MDTLKSRHLLGIKDLQKEEIELIFDWARNFKDVLNRPIKKVPSLRDVTVANVFSRIAPEQGFPLSWPKSDYLQM